VNPETIQAIAVAVATVMGPLAVAWSARTRKELTEVKARVKKLEESEAESRRLFRIAVRNIRDWLRWDTNGRVGAPPSIPDDLKDEV